VLVIVNIESLLPRIMKLLSWLLVHTFGSSVQLSLNSVKMNRFAPSTLRCGWTKKEAETRKEKYVRI
jgi:hypothetical protein